MKALIVYNGSIEIEKIDLLVEKIKTEAENRGIECDKVKNNQIIPLYDVYGEARYGQNMVLKDVDCIIFWDKDVSLAKYLEDLKIKVFNKADAIEICDSKIKLHQFLSGSGIKTPKTIIGPLAYYKQNLNKEYFDKIISELGPNFILKEANGSFGMQVYQIKNFNSFTEIMEKIGNNEFLMQKNILTSEGRDIRVNIVGDKIVGSMLRINEDDFRANITLGGKGEVIELTDMQKNLAMKVHRKLGLDFSGVDLLFGKNDEVILCEVNSNVNFLSYEKIANVNIASMIIEHVMGVLNLEE